MSMIRLATYQVWHVDVPMEYIEAFDSFSARKAFAEKHRKPLLECMARKQ